MSNYTISNIVLPNGDVCTLKDPARAAKAYRIVLNTTDWTSTNSGFSAAVNATGMTANTELSYTIDESKTYLKSNLEVEPGSGVLVFTTAVKPTGTLNIVIWTVGEAADIINWYDILGLYIDNDGYICQQIGSDT